MDATAKEFDSQYFIWDDRSKGRHAELRAFLRDLRRG